MGSISNMTDEQSSKYNPVVVPTKMPDGTTLVGVIYDCGGGAYDMLFYEDGIWIFPGSTRDNWVSAQPFGIDVAHGKLVDGLPALGPAKRPEARRLAAMLRRGTRTEVSNALLKEYQEEVQKGKRGIHKPSKWLNNEVKEMLLYAPRMFGGIKLTIVSFDTKLFAVTVENNDYKYMEMLLEACFPGRWREISKREERALEREYRSHQRVSQK